MLTIRRHFCFICFGALALSSTLRTVTAYDLLFDYTSFESGFQQPHFNVLNYPSINGHYMMTSTDNHRPEMVANGNALAEFYNNFNADYNHPTAERRTPAEEAAHIDAYTRANSTKNGPRPEWLILNEISASQWQLNPGVPGLSEHRTWVIDTVTLLNDVYGYKVVTYSPYQTVGTANGPSWQALAAKSYVAIEAYLSGPEVMAGGGDYASRVNWARGQYQAAKNSYLNAGVPHEKIFVSEHFANNNTHLDNGTPVAWGRAGMASAADWDQVIMARQDAMLTTVDKNGTVGFEGFLAYNWGGNGMGVSQAEQLQHEYYYRSRRVLPSQRPQWLSDSAINVNGTTIPLSWSQPLNWLGGVPNAAGAEVNFYKTLSASRTIALDGSKTVGAVSFDSPHSYTIAPGTGGNLVFDGSSAAPSLLVNEGDHTIGAPVQLAETVAVTILTGDESITFSGVVSGAGGLTKSGAGLLVLSAPSSYQGTTTVSAGTLRANGNLASAGGAVAVGGGARLEISGPVQRALVNNGVVAAPTSPASVTLAGQVSGAGAFTGNVEIAGVLSPGNSIGTLIFQQVKLTSASTLAVELGAQSDRVAASGAMTLDGALSASFVSGFTPSAGKFFNILDWGSVSGAFDALTLPALDPSLMWNASRLYIDGTLRISQAGDYDFNGVVDAADLGIWQSAVGQSGMPPFLTGNGDGDGDVDGADFLAWQRNVGAPGALISQTAVPEPHSFMLAVFASAMTTSALRRRRKAPSLRETL